MKSNKLKVFLLILACYMSISLISGGGTAEAKSFKFSESQRKEFKKIYDKELREIFNKNNFKSTKEVDRVTNFAFNCLLAKTEKDFKFIMKLKKQGKYKKLEKLTQAYINACSKKAAKKFNIKKSKKGTHKVTNKLSSGERKKIKKIINKNVRRLLASKNLKLKNENRVVAVTSNCILRKMERSLEYIRRLKTEGKTEALNRAINSYSNSCLKTLNRSIRRQLKKEKR